jgi:hypothetical protein
MYSVNEDIDHEFLKDVLDNGLLNVGKPGEMERLQKAKNMLDGWKQSNGDNANNGSINIWIKEVNKLIDKNGQMKAGRRRRKNRKSRKSKKSRKVRNTRKN